MDSIARGAMEAGFAGDDLQVDPTAKVIAPWLESDALGAISVAGMEWDG